MARLSRFECASSSLTLKALLRKTQRVLWICLGLGGAIHLSLMQISGVETEHKVAKPLTTQFVKRQPRLTKPLELKKRPQPKRRTMHRKMVSVKAEMQRDQRSGHFQPMQVLRGLARPTVDIGRIAAFGSVEIEPKSMAEIIEGTKEVEQKIDMSLELLDIDALNTGKYHAMVVQDPKDKRNLQGFCRLSCLYIPRLHDRSFPGTGGRGTAWFNHYVAGPVRNLVGAMNEYTEVETRVGERVTIDNPELFRMPWVFHLYFCHGYRLSDTELEILGRYLVQGGLIFADAHPSEHYNVASSHTENLLAALETRGIRTAFKILPASHPVYHCYFDFTAPPPGHDTLLAVNPTYSAVSELTPYLEGIEVENRLVAILSRKGYYSSWCDWGPGPHGYKVDPTRQFQFGVNLIVFALTQEGSITHQLMDSVK